MTEHKIVSAIENYVTSFEGVTDFSITLDQIGDEVDTLRLRLFDEKDIASRLTMSLEPYLQTIEAKATTYDSVKKLTVVEIPRIHIRDNGKAAIRFCGSVGYKTPYRVVTGNHFLYATHDKYIGKAPLAHYEEGRITFFNAQLKKVLIKAVFVDPSELVDYGYDKEVNLYPVPKGIADIIIGKTAESYLRTLYRISPQPNTQSDNPNARS